MATPKHIGYDQATGKLRYLDGGSYMDTPSILAEEIVFDDANTGLQADNVQDALEALEASISTVGGTDTNAVRNFSSVAEMREVVGAANKFYVLSEIDSTPRFFRYDTLSTEVDNDITIIKPTSVATAGRFVAIHQNLFYLTGGYKDGYPSRNAVLTSPYIPISDRKGVTVQYYDDTNTLRTYWWRDGTEDYHLIEKIPIGAGGITDIISINSPTSVEAKLLAAVFDANEQATITGINTGYELGQQGQQYRIRGTLYFCIAYSRGTGSTDGSATYVRTRSKDLLDSTNAQDLAVITSLKSETGWSNNLKTITGFSSSGYYYIEETGWFYMGVNSSGSSTVFRRFGLEPNSVNLFISDGGLIAEIQNHDFDTTNFLIPVGPVKGSRGQVHSFTKNSKKYVVEYQVFGTASGWICTTLQSSAASSETITTLSATGGVFIIP